MFFGMKVGPVLLLLLTLLLLLLLPAVTAWSCFGSSTSQLCRSSAAVSYASPPSYTRLNLAAKSGPLYDVLGAALREMKRSALGPGLVDTGECTGEGEEGAEVGEGGDGGVPPAIDEAAMRALVVWMPTFRVVPRLSYGDASLCESGIFASGPLVGHAVVLPLHFPPLFVHAILDVLVGAAVAARGRRIDRIVLVDDLFALETNPRWVAATRTHHAETVLPWVRHALGDHVDVDLLVSQVGLGTCWEHVSLIRGHSPMVYWLPTATRLEDRRVMWNVAEQIVHRANAEPDVHDEFLHPRKLHVVVQSRRSSRRIANAEELCEAVEKLCPDVASCQVVEAMEELTLDEQVAVTRRADVLIAAFGSGLTHIMWMRPGTLAIELRTEGIDASRYYARLAADNGVHFISRPAVTTKIPEPIEDPMIEPEVAAHAPTKLADIHLDFYAQSFFDNFGSAALNRKVVFGIELSPYGKHIARHLNEWEAFPGGTRLAWTCTANRAPRREYGAVCRGALVTAKPSSGVLTVLFGGAGDTWPIDQPHLPSVERLRWQPVAAQLSATDEAAKVRAAECIRGTTIVLDISPMASMLYHTYMSVLVPLYVLMGDNFVRPRAADLRVVLVWSGRPADDEPARALLRRRLEPLVRPELVLDWDKIPDGTCFRHVVTKRGRIGPSAFDGPIAPRSDDGRLLREFAGLHVDHAYGHEAMLNGSYHAATEAPHRLRVVIASRAAAAERVVVNEAELCPAIGNDCRVVDFARLSEEVQVRTAHEADVLVGVLGSQLSHVLFMRPGSLVVELVPPGIHNSTVIRRLADAVGVRWAAWYASDASHYTAPATLPDDARLARLGLSRETVYSKGMDMRQSLLEDGDWAFVYKRFYLLANLTVPVEDVARLVREPAADAPEVDLTFDNDIEALEQASTIDVPSEARWDGDNVLKRRRKKQQMKLRNEDVQEEDNGAWACTRRGQVCRNRGPFVYPGLRRMHGEDGRPMSVLVDVTRRDEGVQPIPHPATEYLPREIVSHPDMDILGSDVAAMFVPGMLECPMRCETTWSARDGLAVIMPVNVPPNLFHVVTDFLVPLLVELGDQIGDVSRLILIYGGRNPLPWASQELFDTLTRPWLAALLGTENIAILPEMDEDECIEQLVVFRGTHAGSFMLAPKDTVEDEVDDVRAYAETLAPFIADNFDCPARSGGDGDVLQVLLVARETGTRRLRDAVGLCAQIEAGVPAPVSCRLMTGDALPHEQIRQACAADVLVGVYGAGMTHMGWMAPGSGVVEIAPAGLRPSRHYARFAAAMRHEFVSIAAENPEGIADVDPYSPEVLTTFAGFTAYRTVLAADVVDVDSDAVVAAVAQVSGV